MALFQEAIIKKHLLNLDEEVIDSAYREYKRVYSTEKIKNIRVAKEEQYQEGFIKEIFGSVLGYSVYPESPYNIETEKKNETNSRKADGAILKDDKVVGVIELKDNKTKNLDAVKDQAFGYKNNHKDCSYVISSNFHKLRFYIDDATDYEEFDLYNLDKETFKRFYLYLRKEGLLDKNIPKLLRQETKFHEEEISKNLYRDYSNFKRSFFENALKNNPQFDKLTLFKKSQKFLDRVLFVLFAEDKGLLTTNSVVQIVEKWQALRDDAFDTPRPLYTLVLLFFNNLYLGKKDNKGKVLIPEFGGELFSPDEVLDQLTIDDDVLKDDLLKLSKYDFNTDVDVNILGHIFEHSLNEVDDVEAELRGEQLDKTKSKRKKDGVFYTPKYITKYIVDNTLGKLCSEKKAELKLDQDIAIFDYQKTDGKLNEKGKDLFERINTYKSWLLTVKVCDPACGSGAFLNQALSYFIEEHKFVDDIIAELTNTPLRLFDTDLQILENNIFGVDINEESVEIAKLSMWLRTAQPGRKLSDLSNNIKCGNSLIDDPAVAGDKAFNWEKEFPTVFKKGGFDVVIGNPPYVLSREKISSFEKEYFLKHFLCIHEKMNLYMLFTEKAYHLLKYKGNFGFVVPNSWLGMESAYKLREFLLKKVSLKTFINLKGESFPGVNVETVIFTFNKKESESNIVQYYTTLKPEINELFFNGLEQVKWLQNRSFIFDISSDNADLKVIKRINNSKNTVGDKFDVRVGLQAYETGKGSPKQSAADVKNHIYDYDYKFDQYTYPYLEGRDVGRYSAAWGGMWLRWGEWLSQPKEFKQFSEPRILVREITGKFPRLLISTYMEEIFLNNKSIVNIVKKDNGFELKCLLPILNSKLISFFHQRMAVKGNRTLFPKVVVKDIKNYPFPELNNEEINELVNFSDLMLLSIKELTQLKEKFCKYVSSSLNIENIIPKIFNWDELQFSEFIKELNKAIKTAKGTPLSKKDEFEWMDLFEENKKKALELKSQIDQTDAAIDRMVYELYGLTEEEIQIVENS